MKRTMATVAAVVLLFAALLPTVALATGNVTVQATVNEQLVLTPTADGVLLQANTPWTLAVDTTDGVVEFTGTATEGETIALPANVTGYWVVAD